MAEHVENLRRVEEERQDRASRQIVGETDCPSCDARGFTTEVIKESDGTSYESFSWCHWCDHSGRRHLGQSSKGYWAVAYESEQAFTAGEDIEPPAVVWLGRDRPAHHRYPTAKRYTTDQD